MSIQLMTEREAPRAEATKASLSGLLLAVEELKSFGWSHSQISDAVRDAIGPAPDHSRVVCSYCGEEDDLDDPEVESTWQQWQCRCCGSWEDKK